MGIGVGIFLLAVGAILTWAVNVTTSGFNIHTIGWILMAAGALGIIIDLLLFMPRRRRVRSEAVAYDDGTGVVGRERVVRRDVDAY